MMNLGATSDVTLEGLASPARLSAASAREWIAALGLGAGILATQASAVTLTGTLVADDASATPKMYHAALLLAGVLVLFRGRIVRPRNELLLYFGVTIATTLAAYAVLEPRLAVVKLLIALYIAVVAGAVGRTLGRRVVLRACRAASIAFLLLVTVKNMQHVPGFVAYLANPIGHPDVPTLSGGGLNLEATWLALSSIFLIGTAVFVPYALVAAATSAVYASRAGIVVVGIAVLGALALAWGRHQAIRRGVPVSPPPSRTRRAIAVGFAVIAIVAMVGAASVVRQYGDPTYVARRFTSIGAEPGSLGRLTLWRGGLAVFAEYPFGVGAGNAVPTLRRVLGVDVPEDNLHNIYLQHAVETGVPGLVALLLFAAVAFRRLVATRFTDHLLLFAVAYLVVGVIQFTGVDALFWLVYGLQSGIAGDDLHG